MRQYPLKPNDVQHVARQADLYARAPHGVATQIFGNLVMTGDGDQFSAQLLTENPCLGIALHAGQRPATHWAVYMDVAIGEKFRARTDRRNHNQIATLGIYLLATTHWRRDDTGRFDGRLWRFFRLLFDFDFRGFQRSFTGAGRRQYRDIDGDSSGDVFDAAGANRQGAQAMLTAYAHQPWQIDGAFAGRQFVQCQDQRCIAEKIWRLCDFGGQLPIKAFEIVAGQLQHGNGQHAALQLEHGILVWRLDLAHIGIQRLVTKSAETYNENAREPQAGSNDVECAATVFTEALMDRPRFRKAFLAPRFWPLWCGLGLLWLIVQLPYPALLTIGRVLGALMYRVAGDRRRIAKRNLELCFPEKSAAERKRLLKENFASTGIAFFEMAMSWWWSRERLAKLAHIEGLEHLQQAQREGKGVILMAAHFTTLEIGAALLGQQHTIDGMYREHKNPLFDFVQRRGRERHNLDSLAVERDDVRGMLKLLRSGRAIWYAPDQDYGAKQSIFVPLFGIQAATVTATSKFARLGKALVVPFTQERLADGSGYRMVIHPPLEGFPGETEEADCIRINQWVESALRACPEQYLWAHRRFKSRPPGEPKLYAKRG